MYSGLEQASLEADRALGWGAECKITGGGVGPKEDGAPIEQAHYLMFYLYHFKHASSAVIVIV